jgi:hypothetical protein
MHSTTDGYFDKLLDFGTYVHIPVWSDRVESKDILVMQRLSFNKYHQFSEVVVPISTLTCHSLPPCQHLILSNYYSLVISLSGQGVPLF